MSFTQVLVLFKMDYMNRELSENVEKLQRTFVSVCYHVSAPTPKSSSSSKVR